MKVYSGHGREVRDAAAPSDNSRLISCGGDRQLFLWDVATGRILRKFRGHDSEVNVVKINELGSVAISGGYDRSVKVWDLRSKSVDAIQKMTPFSDSVTSLVLSSYEIVAGSVDGSVRTFDIRNGRLVTDHLGPPVTSVSLSSDRLCLLLGCLDSTLRLLDRETGEVLNSYEGHMNKSHKVDSCLSDSDAHVVSGSEDGRVCFWDLVETTMLPSLQAHEEAVTSVTYHPSESTMLTSSVDGTAKVWKL